MSHATSQSHSYGRETTDMGQAAQVVVPYARMNHSVWRVKELVKES